MGTAREFEEKWSHVTLGSGVQRGEVIKKPDPSDMKKVYFQMVSLPKKGLNDDAESRKQRCSEKTGQ